MNQAKQNGRITALEQRLAVLETGIGKGTADLTGIITDICERIGKLEAALETWLVVVNWPDAATPCLPAGRPSMSEMAIPAPE